MTTNHVKTRAEADLQMLYISITPHRIGTVQYNISLMNTIRMIILGVDSYQH
jgi:hypothetical protein